MKTHDDLEAIIAAHKRRREEATEAAAGILSDLVSVLSIAVSLAVFVCLVLSLMVWDVFSLASDRSLEASQIVFLLQGIMTIQLTTRDLSEQMGWIKSQMLFFEKYFGCLDRGGPDCSQSSVLEREPREPVDSLELSHCSFDYGHENRVLRDINLVLKRGEIVAVVGANGSGKTTLTRVLLGLYKPTTGRLSVNKTPLTDADMRTFWDACLYVPQNFARFHFLMRESVALGDESLGEFVDPLEPRGGAFWAKRERQLGREFGGIDLSGGQWQRLAILRAYARRERAQILVFDEPTASIDPLIESQVYDLIESISRDRISVFVTHRMSTVAYATRVLLMSRGRIVADGTHDELYDAHPLYRKMYDSQAGRYKRRA